MLLGVATAQAQTSVKLVGNTGQTAAFSTGYSDDKIVNFTTGSHANGYTLTHVDIRTKQTEATAPEY